MSTWIYLECLDHDPPIRAEGESGQHLSDLPGTRRMVANRDELIRAVAVFDGQLPDGYFERHTMRFLMAHPKCRLRIVDEYEREHPLTELETA